VPENRWVAVRRTTDGIIVASPCILRGVTVHSTTAEGGVLLYDNASAASGTVVADIFAAVDEDTVVALPLNVRCMNGLYADLTTANIVVYYELED
jgi:hypothetical protein